MPLLHNTRNYFSIDGNRNDFLNVFYKVNNKDAKKEFFKRQPLVD